VIEILAALIFDDKPYFPSKIKEKYFVDEQVEFLCIFARRPKTKKSFIKLSNYLNGYGFKFILPKTVANNPLFSSLFFSGEPFVKRGLADSFLNYIKYSRPKGIAIWDDGFLGEKYYEFACRFTDNLNIKSPLATDSLKELILKESGIVLGQSFAPDKNFPLLNLSNANGRGGAFAPVFDAALGVCVLEKLRNIMPQFFLEHSMVDVAATYYYEWGYKNILNMYTDLIKQELKILETGGAMLYNIY
jgi:hypothetical protein